MSFHLTVPSDGAGVSAAESVKSFTERHNELNVEFQSFPKEFEIMPSSGIVMPLSEMEIQVSKLFIYFK